MNKIEYIIIVLSLICVISCSEGKHERREGQTELVGVAAELADHSEKSNCLGIIVDEQKVLFKGNFKSFKRGDLGRTIKVTGILKQEHLPMFIADEKRNSQKTIPQGMSMLPGTDIKKESLYYIIENPKWTIQQ